MSVFRWRAADSDREAGAYAILYAALVVVLIAFAAIVVDIAAVREDRRLNRSAADSAALGGAYLLDPNQTTGIDPYHACLQAWKYLETSLTRGSTVVTTPAGACGVFQGLTPSQITAKCASANPTELYDNPDWSIPGNRKVRISWPIPDSGGSGFLNPDLAPGSAGSQPANGTSDGNPALNGCDRLGVAIWQDQGFGLGSAFGATQATTQVHSVARVFPQQGPAEDTAALNVLNPTACESLVTTGGGKVTVGPVLDNSGAPQGPGAIAVEASGTTNCGGQNEVIDPTTGQGSKICASATAIGANLCDGMGKILSHALDPGGVASRAYNSAAIPANLAPTPIAEGGTHGWVPVTKHYGCAGLSSCNAPSTNYIADLVAAYGGNSSPGAKHYSSSQSPYVDPYTAAFDSPASLCPGGNGISGAPVILGPGNHYANCDLKISGSGTLIVQGGTLVVKGSVSVASGGCLVMNTAVSTCPAAADVVTQSGNASTVSTTVAPTHDAIVYIQGNSCPNAGCFQNAGNLIFPQTFVYMDGSAPLNQSSTGLTLWTAPGAGFRDANGNTTLEVQCGAAYKVAANEACMDSRFGRLALWSEYAAPSTKAHQFAGQGNLNVVGIFFTPRAYFNFTGGGGYTGSAAQFWSDQLNVNGGANLGLSPYASFSLPSFGPYVGLIR